MYGSLEPPPVGWAPPQLPQYKPRRRPHSRGTRALAGALSVGSLMLLGVMLLLQRYDDSGMDVSSVKTTASRMRALLYHRHASASASAPPRAVLLANPSPTVTDRIAVGDKSASAGLPPLPHGPSERARAHGGKEAVAAIEFSVENKYGKHVYKESLYPWLDGKKLIEPYMDTTLAITQPQPSTSYQWTLSPVSLVLSPLRNLTSGSDGLGVMDVRTYTGDTLTLNLAAPGLYTLQVDAVDATTGKTVATSKEDVYVKYVRREIRQLTTEDREAFFEAANTLWDVNTWAGKAKYGKYYKDIHYFSGYHLTMSAQKDCDHMHDGLGFMTEHLALTLKFEETLRMVDPSVSLPYWDFTMDVEHIKAQHGGNFSRHWFDSEVFTAEYFGSVDPVEHTVTSGRWAYKPIGTGGSKASNAYGMLRAPWNSNPSKYVTRVSSFCGYEWDQDFPSRLPDCELHYNMLAGYNSWSTFGSKVSYDPHGGIHAITGGTFECEELYGTLQTDYNLSKPFAQWFSWWTYGLQRAYWRSGLMTCPSDCSTGQDLEECRCSCDVDDLLDTYGDMDSVLVAMLNNDITHRQELLALSDDKKRSFAEMVCGSSFVMGDQIEASSPYDISFWPIHPTVERLWVAKKLRGLFTSEDWPSGSSQYSGGCSGHDVADTIPIAGLFDTPDAKLTNSQMYAKMDPSESNLPHVFDNFDWTHCKDHAGLDFTKVELGKTTTDIYDNEGPNAGRKP